MNKEAAAMENDKHNLDPYGLSGRPTSLSIIRPIFKITIAFCLAFVILLTSVSGLLTFSQAAPAYPHLVYAYPPAQVDQTGCGFPSVNITKTVIPNEPVSGQMVTINFTITGLTAKPINVVLLQDVTQSMGQSRRLTDSKITAISFTNRLGVNDRLALVAYSNTAKLIRDLTSDISTVTAAIKDLTVVNKDLGTSISEGIRLGSMVLTTTRDNSDAVKALILLSDGQEDQREATITQAGIARDCGILIYTIGFSSTGVYSQLLANIATATDGNFYTNVDDTTLTQIYQEIAMELRNLRIVDVLPPTVGLDCTLAPNDWECKSNTEHYSTITHTVNNPYPGTDPLVISFTFISTLTSEFETQLVNTPDSCISYDGPGDPDCQLLVNPSVCVRPYKQDMYEGDDTWLQARVITHGGLQTHNFANPIITTNGGLTDTDWVRFSYEGSGFYLITTTAVSTDEGPGPRFLQVYRRISDSELDPNPIIADGNSLILRITPTPLPTPIPTAIPTPTPEEVQVYLPIIRKDTTNLTLLVTDTAQKLPLSDSGVQEPVNLYLKITSPDGRNGCGTQYALSVQYIPF